MSSGIIEGALQKIEEELKEIEEESKGLEQKKNKNGFWKHKLWKTRLVVSLVFICINVLIKKKRYKCKIQFMAKQIKSVKLWKSKYKHYKHSS